MEGIINQGHSHIWSHFYCLHAAIQLPQCRIFFLFLLKCMVFFQNSAHWYSTWHLRSRITNNMFHVESCFKKLRHLRKIRHKAWGLKLKSKETKENQKWVIQKSRDTRSKWLGINTSVFRFDYHCVLLFPQFQSHGTFLCNLGKMAVSTSPTIITVAVIYLQTLLIIHLPAPLKAQKGCGISVLFGLTVSLHLFLIAWNSEERHSHFCMQMLRAVLI